MSTPERVDPVQFARLGESVQGRVKAGGLERLAEVSRNPEAEVSYELQGYLRKDEKPAIDITVSGVLTVSCQRCLGDVEIDLHAERTLVFLTAAGLAQVQDEDDDVDYLPREEGVEPLALVEEEILLALPMAPRHPPGGCEAPAGAQDSEPELH